MTFGLGAACQIDKIEVVWPDAASTTSSFEAVQANYPIEISEGEAAVRYIQ